MPGDAFLFIVIFVFGCFIGSFLNVLIWRLPQDLKPTGRSFCPHCKHQLNSLDLVPVLSFVVFGGKCRYCKQNISWRYPAIEVATGSLFLLTFLLLLYPVTTTDTTFVITATQLAFALAVIVVVFVIDLEHYLILNKVVLPATVVVLLFSLGLDIAHGSLLQRNSYLLQSVLGAVVGFLPFYLLWKISKGKWIGLGDAKYGLFLGALFGFPLVLLNYMLACFLGTLFAIPLLATGRKHLSSKLPLGTFLSVAAILVLWFGIDILNWYLSLIGLG